MSGGRKASHPHLAPLFDQAPVLGRIDLLEHRLHAGARLAQGADGLGLLAGGANLFDGVLQRGRVALVVPFPERNQISEVWQIVPKSDSSNTLPPVPLPPAPGQ